MQHDLAQQMTIVIGQGCMQPDNRCCWQRSASASPHPLTEADRNVAQHGIAPQLDGFIDYRR
jgi:hypothetical protein